MATKKGAKRTVRGNGDVRALGRWPTINLITMESADFGEVAEGGRKASAGRNTTDEWLLRIHIDVPLKDLDTYLAVRDELAAGNRKGAHKILKDGGMLVPERKRAMALIKAALLDKGN